MSNQSASDALDGSNTVWEDISSGNELILLARRGKDSFTRLLLLVQFQGRRPAERRCGVAVKSRGSRGERTGVWHLAKMLKSGSNVLLLTNRPRSRRPTHNMRSLEEALEDFCRLRRDQSAMIAGSSIASPPTFSPSKSSSRSMVRMAISGL